MKFGHIKVFYREYLRDVYNIRVKIGLNDRKFRQNQKFRSFNPKFPTNSTIVH